MPSHLPALKAVMQGRGSFPVVVVVMVMVVILVILKRARFTVLTQVEAPVTQSRNSSE